MARAFPLGPTAIQNGKIGEASYMFYALESIFFMFCCFPDFVCADVACPDVPIFCGFMISSRFLTSASACNACV